MSEDGRMNWEEALIADMREHEGRPASGPLAGQPLLVLHTTGAKSGEPRRAILSYSRDGDAYVVAGTANAAPRNPAWVANIRAHPDVTIEIGKQARDVTATVAGGDERQRLWDQHVAALPRFAEYPSKVQRPIPMVRLVAQT